MSVRFSPNAAVATVKNPPQEHYMKILTYSSPVDSEGTLVARIVEAGATTRQKPGNFERTHQILLRLCRVLI